MLAWQFGWNLPAYPEGVWYFNPFAWQLLFVFGAWCALGGADRLGPMLRSPITLSVAAAYLLFAFAVALSWYLPEDQDFMPLWVEDLIYPIDKTNLDVLRFAHFLALAALTVRFVPRTWPVLNSWVFKPAIICGQHSLEIFCLGVFLAFAGHFAMVEISGAVWMQVLISALGILVMVGTAALIKWYKDLEGRSPGSRRKTAGRGPRRRGGMRAIVAAIMAAVALTGRAYALDPPSCAVPELLWSVTTPCGGWRAMSQRSISCRSR